MESVIVSSEVFSSKVVQENLRKHEIRLSFIVSEAGIETRVFEARSSESYLFQAERIYEGFELQASIRASSPLDELRRTLP